MKYVILKKIESMHKNLRTDEITGMTLNMPTVGNTFFMYADPLDTDAKVNGVSVNTRYIHTSIVQEVIEHKNGEISFKTANSVYTLNITGEHNVN